MLESGQSLTIGVHVPEETSFDRDESNGRNKGIARVIGKAGAGLKQIRESSGCKIQVSESIDWSKKRRVSLTGPVHGLGIALQQTLVKAFQDELSNLAVTVMIPDECAPAVIGKGGNNLKRLRMHFGVSMQVEREPVTDPQFGSERVLTMSSLKAGSSMAFGQALSAALSGDQRPLMPTQMPPSVQVASLPPQVAGGLDVRQQTGDPEDLQLHMAVPNSLVGAILGKEGAVIKQTGMQCNCKISVTKKDPMVGDRRIVIMGKYQQCQSAVSMLQQQLESAAQAAASDVDVGTTCITYYIRSSAAGAVIGKGGATLRNIRESTGTKIQFDREEIHGQRPCTISGNNVQVMQAVSKIFEIVSQESPDTDSVDHGGSKRMAATPVVATSGQGMKRQRIEGQGDSTKILVPARCAGAVIGKQGSGLARIREQCGVKVEVLSSAQAAQWPEDRVVILGGSFDSRESAIARVLESAFQQDTSNSSLKMLVQKAEVGRVIGKGAATLKKIREHTGVNVHVEKHDILGERLVQAQGPLSSIMSVAQWVMWSIDGREDGADVEPSPVPTSVSTIPPAPAFAAIQPIQGGYTWHGL